MGKFTGIAYEPHPVSPERKAELRAQGLKILDVRFKPALLGGGPTVAEWVAAGYQVSGYPPAGYESRSSAEEVAAALAEQAGHGMTVEQARADLAARGIEFGPRLQLPGLLKLLNEATKDTAEDESADEELAAIKAALAEKGVEFDPALKKPELLALLLNQEEA